MPFDLVQTYTGVEVQLARWKPPAAANHTSHVKVTILVKTMGTLSLGASGPDHIRAMLYHKNGQKSSAPGYGQALLQGAGSGVHVLSQLLRGSIICSHR